MNDFKKSIEEEAQKAIALVEFLYKNKVDEAEEAAKEKTENAINKLKTELQACSQPDDVKNVISGLLNVVQKKDDQIEQLTELMTQYKTELDCIKKNVKKIKGTFLRKIMKGVMKWGAVIILIGTSGFYLYSKMPQLAQKAIKAEVTAVKDDISILSDAVQGNVKTINKVIDDQNKMNHEFAQRFEKEHAEIVKQIDGVTADISKVLNIFKSEEQQKTEHAERVKELQGLIKEWKDLKSQKQVDSSLVDKFKNLINRTQETTDGVKKEEGVDNSVKILMKNIEIGAKDIKARLLQPATEQPTKESIEFEFRRQKRLAESITARYGKLILTESFLIKNGRKEAAVHKAIYDVWKNTERNMQNPGDVKKWYFRNKSKILKLINDRSVSSSARNSLQKAFNILSYAVEGRNASGSFIKRHWLKILVLICYITLFILAGFAGVGAATASTGIPLGLSNTEALITFLGSGWAMVWRVFLGMLTAMGIGKLIKWKLFK